MKLASRLDVVAGNSRALALLGMLIAVAVGVQSVNPNFLAMSNVAVIGLQVSFVGIAAIGTSLLMIGGQLDLSVGSTFALAAVTAAMLAKLVAPECALLAGIAVGMLVGLVNGLIIWRVRISPLVVTLGSLTVIRGIVLIATGNRSVSAVPEEFSALGQFRILAFPSPFLVFIGVAASAAFVMSRTRIGLRIRAFGTNPEAASLAGIVPLKLTVGLFVFNGLMAGLAGVLAASRLGGASPMFGSGFELEVITAVILGGVSITGGEGRIGTVLLAVALLGVIQAGIVALGLDPNIGRLCTGGALILAVAVDQLGHERHEKRQRKLAMEEFASEDGIAARLGLKRRQPDSGAVAGTLDRIAN